MVDAEGCLVTPGLVDGHTHLVFGGYRQNEIPLKLAGAGYLEILKAGGGILDTLTKTRSTSFEELYEKSEDFLDEMMSLGVTTCEAKSGYGLDLETEMKMLRITEALERNHPMIWFPPLWVPTWFRRNTRAEPMPTSTCCVKRFFPLWRNRGLQSS